MGQTEELLGSDNGAKDRNVFKQVLPPFYSSFPLLFRFLFYIRYLKLVQRTRFLITGCVPPCIFLLIIAYIGCYRTVAVVLLILSMTFTGTSFVGFLCNHNDLAPNYAGILMGITNTPGTLPAFIFPAVVSLFTHDGVRDETLLLGRGSENIDRCYCNN